MEGLSNGMLLDRMNEEYESMLLSIVNSSAASSVLLPRELKFLMYLHPQKNIIVR